MKDGYFCLLRSSKQRQADLQIVLLALPSLDLTAFLVGWFDARGAMTLDTHTLVMDTMATLCLFTHHGDFVSVHGFIMSTGNEAVMLRSPLAGT